MNRALWQVAKRNVLRQSRRSLITAGAFAFGFAAVILLGGYMLRMDRYLATQGIYLNHVGHISVFKKDGLEKSLSDPDRYSLSKGDQLVIEKIARDTLSPPPEFVGRWLHGEGLITNGCVAVPFLATGTDVESERRIRSHPEVLSRLPELVRLESGRGFWEPGAPADGIAISSRLASLLKKPLVAGDPREDTKAMAEIISNCQDASAVARISRHSGVQLVGTSFFRSLAASDARIAATYSTGLALTDENSMLTSLTFLQSFLNTEKVTSMAIYLAPPSWTPLAMNKLKSAFAARGLDFELYPYYDERVNPFYVGAMSFVYVMTIFFLVLVCGVVALSILNSLQISLFERRTEIGTLRAIGFRPEVLVRLFLMETSLVCAAGLIIGSGLGATIAELVNTANIRFKIVGSSGDLQLLLQPGWIFSSVVALIFAAAAGLTAVLICRRFVARSVVDLLESK